MTRPATAAARPPGGWRGVPFTASVVALALLLVGLWVIFRYDLEYQAQKRAEVQVQADVLGAGVTAALDFGDPAAAQESVDALRVNRQLLAAGVYDQRGRLFAGFARQGTMLAQALTASPRVEAGFVVDRPVERAGARVGTVRLVAAGDSLSRRLARYSIAAMLVGLAALVVGVLGAAHKALSGSNADLASANEALRIEIEERAKAEEALRQAQKMQALGQLTGGIAHDFNNLLTVIGGSADLLKRPVVPDDKRIRFASAIAQTAERAAALTSQLLAFARRQPLRPQVVDLNAQILGMMDLLERSLGARVEVRTELDPDLCHVEVDPTQLEVAILNIAVNARDAMPEGGAITINTAMRDDVRDEPMVALAISDSGAGIAPDVVERVFEPFFTTKSVGKGTGLGLSQVYGFITQSGGEVRVDSAPGQGTTVTMVLPCTDKPLEVAPPTARAEEGRKARILLVEDNEEVGTFAETLLGELGHEVIRARSGEEALALIEGGAAFDVTFSDIVMPGISGIELAERIATLRPGAPVILTSGYSDQLTSEGAGGRPVISKPYSLEALTSAMAKALGC